MDYIFWYGVAVSGCFAVMLLAGLQALFLRSCTGRFIGSVTDFTLRQLVYPHLYPRLRWLGPITRLKALILAIYCGSTVFSNAYSITNADQASIRAGWLSVINTIPLFLSGRAAIASKLFGISLDGVLVTHATTGLMVAGQALAHIILEVTKAQVDLRNRIQLYGITVSIAIAAILVTLWLRRPFFELFRPTHAILAWFAVISLWLHIHAGKAGQGLTKQYLGLTLILYGAMILTQLCLVVFQNMIKQRKGAQAYISIRGTDGVVLTMNLEKPLNARPGQFIYVWMGISPFETHPFMVISEDDNDLKVLIQSQTGFSRKLRLIAEAGDTDRGHLTWIDGPYGNPPAFGDYESVFLVANGIGVAAHLSVLRSLLVGYHKRTVKTKRIIFYWHTETSANRTWVKDWFDELIQLDVDNILKIRMYQPDSAREDAELEAWGQTDRVKRHFDVSKFIADLTSSIGTSVGDTIVSGKLCTVTRA
ncbi:hypothetical protein H2204_011716 [Knufia peltigerae]|uniref:ferric-chelate reductase (NADPH) n=1 Tax=Knufia peltigerae TaxID=1002370 RepID=A0AA38XTR6_9EURO|nr:hypothetical protein H2204_011716 [Knufia peltigerae]